jgi:hypothetical protein
VGSRISHLFKVVDAIGSPITNTSRLKVKSSVQAGGGSISGPAASDYYLGFVSMTVTLSNTPGLNVFQFQVDNFDPITIAITGVKGSQ